MTMNIGQTTRASSTLDIHFEVYGMELKGEVKICQPAMMSSLHGVTYIISNGDKGFFKALPLTSKGAFVDYVLRLHALTVLAFAKPRSCRAIHDLPCHGKPCEFLPFQTISESWLHLQIVILQGGAPISL